MSAHESLLAAILGQHIVSFTAEDGRLLARCCCGWHHAWTPNTLTIEETDYGLLFGIGLGHTKDVAKETAA